MLSREASQSLPDGELTAPEELPESVEVPPSLRVVPFLSETQRGLLRRSLCQKLTDDQSDYFFEVVERTKLDPFTGQIRPIIRNNKDEDGTKIPTLVVIVQLQGLRGIGDRSGKLDGEAPIEWCSKDGIWLAQWLSSEPPVAARGTVFRKDRAHPQVNVCRWDAFVQSVYDRGGNEIPNKFWKKMGSLMLGKCSLAGAYRGAFPNLCSGLYLQEEIGEELDPESEIAIEAEMNRRANAEKGNIEKARAAGFTIVPEKPAGDKKRATKEKERPVSQPAPVMPDPLPPPPVPAPAKELPTAPPVPAANDQDQIWSGYVLTRIKALVGRTVGSLTLPELRALRENWIPLATERWGNIDGDLREHCTMLQMRLDHEEALEKAATSSAATELEDMTLPFPT
jgi:phage recombination protein Bet